MSTRTVHRLNLDASAITGLLTDPDLFAPQLPGEDETEHAARTAAAADITDDHLDRIAQASIAEDGIGHVTRLVQAWSEKAADDARAWIGRAAS